MKRLFAAASLGVLNLLLSSTAYATLECDYHFKFIYEAVPWLSYDLVFYGGSNGGVDSCDLDGPGSSMDAEGVPASVSGDGDNGTFTAKESATSSDGTQTEATVSISVSTGSDGSQQISGSASVSVRTSGGTQASATAKFVPEGKAKGSGIENDPITQSGYVVVSGERHKFTAKAWIDCEDDSRDEEPVFEREPADTLSSTH